MPGEVLNGFNSATEAELVACNGGTNGRKTETKPERYMVINDAFSTSYPSHSLHFLRKLARSGSHAQVDVAKSAKLRLKVVVVGAGLGGLSLSIALARRGHSVVVLERAQKLGEVGAGIQIPPNSARLLRRWGVFEHLEASVVRPSSINFRRWEDGTVIGLTNLGPQFQEQYDSPYYVVHRAHFHDALHKKALELGVIIKLNSHVIEYNAEDPSVVLEDDSVVEGDLVVGADGIKSKARDIVSPSGDHEPRSTGFAAYRATVDVDKMKQNPEIAWLLERPSLNIWIGEDRHVMTYPIAAGRSFNMVLSHVDHSDSTTWSQQRGVDDILQQFIGWDPQLTKVIGLIDSSLKWPLKTGARLTSWTAPSCRLIIMGDAAHAMLPYMSQGAAMAVEDGAALATVLSKIHSIRELPFALSVFETERIKRAGDMQEASSINGALWHFPDGPEQQARDAAMKAEVEGRAFISSPNQWSDPTTQCWAYGYEAEAATESAWDDAVSALITRRI